MLYYLFWGASQSIATRQCHLLALAANLIQQKTTHNNQSPEDDDSGAIDSLSIDGDDRHHLLRQLHTDDH